MAQTGTINDLDSSLLMDRDEESRAAGELREGRRGAAAASEQSEGGEPGLAGKLQSLREATRAARQAMDLKAAAKEKLATMAAAPAKQGLNYLLKAAWLNLIDSFGLTLIWINIHVFLRWSVSDKLFCKLGEEWLPKEVTRAGGTEVAETANKGIGLLEIIVLLILDLIILAVILGVLALIVMIVQFMEKSWWDKLSTTLEAFWGAGWGTVKALYDLFSGIKLN